MYDIVMKVASPWSPVLARVVAFCIPLSSDQFPAKKPLRALLQAIYSANHWDCPQKSKLAVKTLAIPFWASILTCFTPQFGALPVGKTSAALVFVGIAPAS